jgi:glycosyltransferase involved in cell wall biosynthesis
MTSHLLCVGGEDHALRLPFLAALKARGFSVSAAGTGDPAPFRQHGIAFYPYSFDRFSTGASHWSTVRHLARLLHEVRPNLIQTFDTKPNLLVPVALRGALPVVRTVNGMGWTFSSNGLKALALRPAYLAMQKLAAFWSSATVFQNKDDKDYFSRYRLLGGRPSVLIAGSGIDVSAFESAQANSGPVDNLREELGLGNGDTILTVSRLTVQKGIQTLLSAAPIVFKQRPNARFLLVGPRQSEGPFAINQAEIDQYAPYVIAPGSRPDVPALLKLADVFAFPTEYREGVPRVLLEAGLAGIPIVTTRMPGCTDVVTEGWNGHLVPARDPQALASRILALLEDRARARVMGARSIALVRREFDLNVVADSYACLYRQILASRKDEDSRPRFITPIKAGNRSRSGAS